MGKLIDGDKLISTLVWGHYEIGKQLQTVQKAINDMRGEDAVPVIRCKGCIHAVEYLEGKYLCYRSGGRITTAEGFCDKGEEE